MSARRPIEARNLRFATSATTIPRAWHGGRRAVTTFFDNLSVFFPAGERFFIRAVRAHEDKVKDATLLSEMRAFYQQEGIHGREHVRYNEMSAAHGRPVAELEAEVEALLAEVEGRLPRRARLAVTAALEHFTAILAHLLLADPKVLENAHPEMAALWRWHAAEEAEHKAVAFDVFEAVGGTYAERVSVMFSATLVFWEKVFVHQLRLMRHEGIATDWNEWRDLFTALFVEPGTLRKLVPLYLAYYRPGFHPNDLDSSGLIERWRQGEAAPRLALVT